MPFEECLLKILEETKLGATTSIPPEKELEDKLYLLFLYIYNIYSCNTVNEEIKINLNLLKQ